MIKSEGNIRPEDTFYIEVTTPPFDGRWYTCMQGEVFKVVNKRDRGKDYYKVLEFTDNQLHKYKTCYGCSIDIDRLNGKDNFYGIYKSEGSQNTFKVVLTKIIKRNRDENKG